MERFIFSITFIFISFATFSQVVPEVAWKQITWAYLNPDGTENETAEDSGEDWWYSHIKVFKAGVHVGYMTTGYIRPPVNLITNPSTTNDTYLNVSNSRYLFSPNMFLGDGEGDCEHLDTDPIRRGATVGNAAFSDIAGNVIWNYPYNSFDIQQALQINDNEFLLIGSTLSTTKFDDGGKPLIYNPDSCASTTPFSPANNTDLMSQDQPSITGNGIKHMYIAKIDASGKIIWEYIYGIRVYTPGLENAAYNARSDGYDITATNDGNFIAVGMAVAVSGEAENFLIKINSNGCLVIPPVSYSAEHTSTIGESANGSFSWGIASNNTGNYAVVGREYFPSILVDYTRAFIFAVDNNLVKLSTWPVLPIYFNNPIGPPAPQNSTCVEVTYHQGMNKFLVPVIGACDLCAEAGPNVGEASIYIVDNTGSTTSGPIPFSTVNAFDLRVGITETVDGGYAVVSSRRNIQAVCPTNAELSNDMTLITCPALACSVAGFDFTGGAEKYWDTDAVVAKYNSSNIQEWIKTFDAYNDNYLTPAPREPFPGNLKRQECLYKITEDADGSLVISGNTGANFDDNYLVKLFNPCQKDFSLYNVPLDSDHKLHIIVTTTLNNSVPIRKIDGQLIVESGVTLTINGNAILEFADSRRIGFPTGITVRKGGKLIVNGNAVLRSLSSCEPAFWDGIVVEGTHSLSQTAINQGTVEITNASIERAINGVSTYVKNTDGTFDFVRSGGGIVRVTNSNFNNCETGFYFAPYTRYNIVGNPINNISYVRENIFTTTTTFGDNSSITQPNAFIYNNDTWAISMYGNTFTNNRINVPYYQWGRGVVTIDSKLNLVPKCSIFSGLGPCPVASRIGNKYNNLFIGVDVMEAHSNALVTVDQGEFNNCLTGIQIESAGFGNITRNVFNITMPDILKNAKDAIGIYLGRSWGYKVEENVFNNFGGGTPGTRSNGTIVLNNDHGGGGANIYRNDFNNLTTGTQTIGDNNTLQIDCNRFTKSSVYGIADIFHADGNLGPQGACSSDPKDPQANEFYGSCNNIDNFQIYRNSIASGITYNSYPTPSYVLPTSTCISVSVGVNNCPLPGGSPYIRNVACPTTLGLSHSASISLFTGAISSLLTQITNAKNLIDGGNTVAVLNYLATHTNPRQIETYLNALSPYLSEKVLVAAINKNLPNGMIKQILLNNSSLSPTVILAVQNYPYPAGIKNQILNAQNGTGPMIDLQNEIQYLETQKLLNVNELVKTYLDSNRVDSALYVLKLANNTEALCAMLPIQIRVDTIAADSTIKKLQAIANDMMALEATSQKGEDLNDFCTFHHALLQIKSRADGIYGLTSTERESFINLVENNSSNAIAALGILNFLDKKAYQLQGKDYIMPNGTIRTLENTNENNTPETNSKLELNIFPNPNSGLVTITINNLENGNLFITDLSGRILIQKSIINSNSKINYSLNDLTSGVYFVIFNSKDGKVCKKMVVSK